VFTASVQPIIRPFYTVWILTLTLLSLTLWVEQILAALVIILKRGMRLTERAPTITARTVLVITARIIIMERILVASEHKKGSKDRYYRLY